MFPEQLVQQLHAAPLQCVLYLTGGGSRAVSALLTHPGASQTVLEVRIPYSAPSLVELLGAPPEHALSGAVAAGLAERARRRALSLKEHSVSAGDCVGLGCTAALATNRPRHGPHCAYVGLCTEAGVRVTALHLTKGARSRSQEEDLVARFVLNTLGAAAGVPEPVPLDLLTGESIEEVPLGG